MNNNFKVNFFCVGVAKAGTTTLHELLCFQDNICLPNRKETNYFSFGWSGKPNFTGPLDSSSINNTTITSFQEYIKDFSLTDKCLIGEVCPSYFTTGVAERLREHNPESKIIILLREPVARAYSNYQHLVRDGREYGSFEHALANESERINGNWEWFWALKKNSLYYELVNEYLSVFGSNNVKIILFEDFIKNQYSTLEDVLDFIGSNSTAVRVPELASNRSGIVSSKWYFMHRLLLADGVINSTIRFLLPTRLRKRLGALFKQITTVKGAVEPEHRERLAEEFRPDLEKLNTLLSGKVGHWLRDENVP